MQKMVKKGGPKKTKETGTKLLEIKQMKFGKLSLNCEEHSKQIHYIGILQVALL